MSDTPINNLDAFWMPFTNNRHFKQHPRMLASAEGMYYQTPEGQNVLDGTAGLWCVNAGHGRQSIVDAIKAEAETLDYAPTFQLGHPRAFELAAALEQFFPDPLNRVFFSNSGSEAVDTALKIALAYQRSKGEAGRFRLIGRERAYHGVGFGGISVGGIVGNRRQFGTLLPGVDHLPHTHNPEHNAFSKGQPAWGAHLADDLERLVALHGPETIAAVIVEPMAGSTGVLVPPKGYLERLREICTRHGILLIFDEVITAFGRLGAASAAEYFGVTPDIITCAKGLTNGSVPMGAVITSDDIYSTVVDNAPAGIELFHGYTYSGHPLAAAAALATLNIYKTENLFECTRSLSGIWEKHVHACRDLPHVIDCRNLGLVAGIELAPRDGAPGARAMEVFHKCFDRGLLIRVTGDIIALSPPLIVEEDHMAELFETLRAVMKEVT